MHKITKIFKAEKKEGVNGSYYQVTAELDNGEEVVGNATHYDDYKVGEEVESYFRDKYDHYEMRKHG
jgi:uncharacterized OB-fold protein